MMTTLPDPSIAWQCFDQIESRILENCRIEPIEEAHTQVIYAENQNGESIKAVVPFRNNQINGVVVFLSSEDLFLAAITYRENVRHGTFIYELANSNTQVEREYVNGVLAPNHKHINANPQIITHTKTRAR